MRAIIHIGTPKSGTTTLQGFLQLNAQALTEQGLRYFQYDARSPSQMELALVGKTGVGRMIRQPNKQHQINARDLASQTAYAQRYLNTLRAKVRDWPEHSFIASSEQLYALLTRPDEIAAFHSAMSEIFESVRYVVYLRAQPDYVLSSYSERLKYGDTLSLDAHIEQRGPLPNYFQRLTRWAEIVGAAALDVRLLERDFLQEGDLISDFCAATGIEGAQTLPRPARLNESLSREMVDLYLRVARVSPLRLPNGMTNLTAWSLIELGKRLTLPKTQTRLVLSTDQRARIAQHHSVSNERLRKRWFPTRPQLFGDG